MRKLYVATSNAHKLDEMRSIFDGGWQLIGMREVGFSGDIDEVAWTLEENAYLKAKALYDYLGGAWVIGEDTGLEAARFAGETATAQDNMAKLLQLLKDVEDRSAQFRTVIALLHPDGRVQYFEGSRWPSSVFRRYLQGEYCGAPHGRWGIWLRSDLYPRGVYQELCLAAGGAQKSH